jgi:hypothetical protein
LLDVAALDRCNAAYRGIYADTAALVKDAQ